MKLENRSLKSKEKFADSLMSTAVTVHSAAFIGVLVFPLTSFIAGVFSGLGPFSPSAIMSRTSWEQIGVFGIVYLIPVAAGMYAKEKAMDIYDQLPDATPKAKFKSPASLTRNKLSPRSRIRRKTPH